MVLRKAAGTWGPVLRIGHLYKRASGAVALATLTFTLSESAAAEGFDLADRFNNALSAVQEGIDLLWPGDLDSEEVNARIGVGMGWMPDYDGSNNYRFRILPLIDVRYKEVWRLNGSQFTYSAYKKGNFEAGPLLNLHFGRQESSNQALEGMGDISTTLDVGVFARYSNNQMLISSDIRQALGAGQGTQIRLTAGHGIYQNGNFAMGAGIRGKWLSKKAMQTNFGVTEEQAANSTSGLQAFEANGGVSELSINVIGALRINDRARILGLVSLGRMLGSAADSPLSGGRYGSATQFVSGTALQFKF